MARLPKVSDAEITALAAVLDDKTFDLHEMNRRLMDKGSERPATDRELASLLAYQAALASFISGLAHRRAMDEHIRETEVRIRADLAAN